MLRFVHVVKKRERGRIDENVDGGEQAKQPHGFMLLCWGIFADRIRFGDAHKFRPA